MTSKPNHLNHDAELDPQKEYKALLRSICWNKGFGLLFVQCSPAEGNRLIARVREDLPEKKIEVLSLKESIDNLYEIVDALPNKDQINTLFIQGIEHSLYEYEKTQLWDEPAERYNYSEKGVPRLLGHLNLGRERFQEHFKFRFVFLVPKFVLKYLMRRAPDFFDWRSGVLEFAMDAERLQEEFQQIFSVRFTWEDCVALAPEQRREEILRIQSLLEESEQTLEQKASLYFEQAYLHTTAGEHEAAISSYDHALELKPDKDAAWYNRGISLSNLGRYEEAISSYDHALELKPDDDTAWTNRGNSLSNLGRYEEAISSYDHALELKPDDNTAWTNRGNSLHNLGRYEEAISSYDHALELKPDQDAAWYNRGNLLHNLGRYEEAISSYDKSLEFLPDCADAFYNKACCYGLQRKIDEAIKHLEQAIDLNPKHRETAKTDSDFDSIRNDDRFQALINETQPLELD
jgi:tetratricopeptide (TPR) repeat protein